MEKVGIIGRTGRAARDMDLIKAGAIVTIIACYLSGFDLIDELGNLAFNTGFESVIF